MGHLLIQVRLRMRVGGAVALVVGGAVGGAVSLSGAPGAWRRRCPGRLWKRFVSPRTPAASLAFSETTVLFSLVVCRGTLLFRIRAQY